MPYELDEMDIDQIYDAVQSSPMGCALFRGSGSLYGLGAVGFDDRITMRAHNDTAQMTVRIARILYNIKPRGEVQDRSRAMTELYERYNSEKGRNRPESLPMQCTGFVRYLDEIGFAESDYAVFREGEE